MFQRHASHPFRFQLHRKEREMFFAENRLLNAENYVPEEQSVLSSQDSDFNHWRQHIAVGWWRGGRRT